MCIFAFHKPVLTGAMFRTAYERTRDLLTKHREDVEKVAQLLLKNEIITREDMIDLLGKRPFLNRADDMDKWLDEHGNRKKGELSAPPPLEEAPPPLSPAMKELDEEKR